MTDNNRAAQPQAAGAIPPAPTNTGAVLLAGKLTGRVVPGGGEVQLQSLAKILPAIGTAARLWRPWEDDLRMAAGLHLLGSEPEHASVVAAARDRGVPVVLSPIAWFSLRDLWRERWPVRRRLIAGGKFVARGAFPRLPNWRRRLYQAVDLLLPNSKSEAQQLIRYFDVPASKIHVVPNGADGRRFAAADPAPFAQLAGCRNFVLYAGRIEPRKNQLGFLRAVRGIDAPVVVLGNPVPGHEEYYDACRRAAGSSVRFLRQVDHDSPLLESAYAACGCLALASWYETPGLVALEAAMSGTPLVLPVGGCAREYFGSLARYVAPEDRAGIRAAVETALRAGRNPELAGMVQSQYSWEAAARATCEGYVRAGFFSRCAEQTG